MLHGDINSDACNVDRRPTRARVHDSVRGAHRHRRRVEVVCRCAEATGHWMDAHGRDRVSSGPPCGFWTARPRECPTEVLEEGEAGCAGLGEEHEVHGEEGNVVVVKLRGGLGNQMFQYALGRTLALKHNTRLKLDVTAYEVPNSVPGDPRRYELDCFRLKASFATVLDVGPALKASSRWRALAARAVQRLRSIEVISERGYPFQPEALESPDNSYLWGYWQSEKYFKAVEPIIRKDFSFRTPLRGQNEELASTIETSEAVSVHVRRGDYVSDPWTIRFLGVLPVSYYVDALQKIAGRTNKPHLFVFSDDQEWCRRNVAFPYETTYVDANPPDKGFEDMRLMTLCRYHVIANSSFSWWGAWLSPYPDKVVYAPGRWVLDARSDTSDVVPPEWVKLQIDSRANSSPPEAENIADR